MSDHDELLYWDPLPYVASVLASDPLPGPRPSPSDVFHGTWEERNWRNVPGPFYGAMTDNCWVGRLHAPRHVLYGDDTDYEQEFLYRQPRNTDELRDVLRAMEEDPFAGWACDGDRHWTPHLVRAWWHDRQRLRDWAGAKHRTWSGSDQADDREAANGLADCLAYLDGDLADHLRAYIYFLDHGQGPTAGDRLPSL